MKQQQLLGYRPKYPRKPLRGAAMTAAALVAIGGVTGCRAPIPQNLQTEGMVAMPEPTEEELVLDGDVAIADPTEEPALLGKIAVTEPPEEELVLDGEVAIIEPTEEPMLRTDGMVPLADPTEEPLVLEGEVAIPEPTEEELRLPGEPYIEEPEPTPEVPLRTTGVLLMPSATPEA